MSTAKLPKAAFTGRPWRIHEIARDFALEDVWALPVRGARGEFPAFVKAFASIDPGASDSPIARALWSLRWKLGAIFKWDDARGGLASRVTSLRDRLPSDLRATPSFEARSAPFQSLYLTADESAAEIANSTVHGILHLGWVPDANDTYRAQMAVLVKPNGRFGRLYMAAIKPFRHAIVYPALMRSIERTWRAKRGGD